MTAPANSRPLPAVLSVDAPARTHAWTAALVPVLVAIAFGSVLASTDGRILSDLATDTARQFLSWRAYGFGELAQGRFPLWNPYVYCGTPYFAGFQSALLYPVNWVHLALPTAAAINVEILLNLTILGLGMYGWLRYSGHSPAVCLCGAAGAALGGSVAPHVYAGHLTNLAAMAWAPWVLLCLDAAWAAATPAAALRWATAGAVAVALQILAGHPQYVYYTALCGGARLVIRALCVEAEPAGPARGRRCLRAGALTVAVYAAGALAAAAQLLPGILAIGENLRAGRLPYHYAGLFSFPPENLLTLIAPYWFGDLTTVMYWGRWYLWEMCAFVGSAALPLAGAGLLGRDRRPRVRADALIALVCLLLAFGSYTPLFAPMHYGLPGYGSFRCPAKFMFFAGLFLLRLAAPGLDLLLSASMVPVRLTRAVGLIAAGGVATVAWLRLAILAPTSAAAALWARVVGAVNGTGQTCLPPESATDPQWLASTAGAAAASTLRTVAILAGILLIVRLRTRAPRLALALPALVCLEMVLFAGNFRVTFSPQDLGLGELQAGAAALQPGERVLHLPSHNLPMLAGIPDIWGNDPGLSRRYAEFMALTQGHGPGEVTQDMSVDWLHPLLRLTGCRYAFVPRRNGTPRVIAPALPPLPRASLVASWAVYPHQADRLRHLADASFDPASLVLLETEPGLTPGAGPSPGTVAVTALDGDRLRVRAQCDRAAILLISQAYSRAWTAIPADRSDPRTYRLLPADHAFQAVPLSAGQHDLLLACGAPGLRLGIALSVGTALAMIGVLAWSRPHETPRSGPRD